MKQRKRRFGLPFILLAAAFVVMVTFFSFGSTATMPVSAQEWCSVDYRIVNQWNTGFQADVTITNNTGTAINGWDLTWTFNSGEQFGSGWN
ncbi:MAG: cellulose binding domain-containing protein, partial [Chloroflexota bacterium]